MRSETGMRAGLPRRAFLAGAAGVTGLGGLAGLAPRAAAAAVGPTAMSTTGSFTAAGLPPDADVAADVRAQLLHAWNGYVEYAWGHDQVLPVSGGYQEFYAEVLAHGGDVALGTSYYRSWVDVVRQYPVPPEEIDYTTFAATSVGNQLRPEYLNAAFDLYLQTYDDIFKTTAYAYFQNMKTYSRVPHGYTIIDDVTTRPMAQGDLFPAYSFAENFKYLYLIFENTPRYDRATGNLSTEGKILRGLRRA
jgi:hypothetical protein